MAAQKAATDTIIEEKRVRLNRTPATLHPAAHARAGSLSVQAARAAREEKARRKEENKQKGLQYQVVRRTRMRVHVTCGLCSLIRAFCRLATADQQHQEDQEDEQKAVEVDRQGGHDGRQAENIAQGQVVASCCCRAEQPACSRRCKSLPGTRCFVLSSALVRCVVDSSPATLRYRYRPKATVLIILM